MISMTACWRRTLGADEPAAGQTNQPRIVRVMTEADSGVQQTDESVAPGESHPEVGTGAGLAEKLLTILAPGGGEALLLLLWTGGADLVSQDVVSEVLLLRGHPALRADHLRHQPALTSLQINHLLGGLFSCQLAGQTVPAGGVETAKEARLQLRTERGTEDAT